MPGGPDSTDEQFKLRGNNSGRKKEIVGDEPLLKRPVKKNLPGRPRWGKTNVPRYPSSHQKQGNKGLRNWK